MPSKTAYRGKNKERPRAHGVHLVSESQNEGSIWACASSYPAHKREMPCIDSNTKRMMKTARKGSDSNTNCITPRHLRKYVHLRLQLTFLECVACDSESLHNAYYQVLRVAIEESSGLIERCIAMHRRVNHWFFATSASILGALALDGAAPALFPVSS